jgi:hypothetical protein
MSVRTIGGAADLRRYGGDIAIEFLPYVLDARHY